MHQLAWHPPQNNWLLHGVIQKPSSIWQRWNSQLVLPWSTRGMDKYGFKPNDTVASTKGFFHKKCKDWRSIAVHPTGEQKPAPFILLRQVYFIPFLRRNQLPHMELTKHRPQKTHRIRRLCACPSWSWLPHNSTLLEQRRSSTRKKHVSTQRLTWH